MTTLGNAFSKVNSNPYPGGATIPTQYDANWPTYTNLSSAQIAAFIAFPQDLLKYAINRHGYYLSVIAGSVTVQQAPALISALATEAQNTINGIAATPATITSRAQIDAALAAIATAQNTPSPT